MYSHFFSVAAPVAIVLLISVGQQNEPAANRPTSPSVLEQQLPVGPVPAADREVLRGRYLAHYVAMCVMCHSPKDDAGMVIEGSEFTGAPMPLQSPFPQGRPWAERAPALRPLVEGNEDGVFQLLTTGVSPRTGEAPRGPMPPFRLNEEDARAVIAYLKAEKVAL